MLESGGDSSGASSTSSGSNLFFDAHLEKRSFEKLAFILVLGMTRTAILLLVVLFSLACSSLAIFGRDKKVATTIEDVLKDAGLAKKYLSVFLEKGWDNSPSVLRRLSKMDLHGIDMSDKEVRDAFLFFFFSEASVFGFGEGRRGEERADVKYGGLLVKASRLFFRV